MVKCSYGFLHIGAKGTLAYFASISFLIYFDRGVIAGILESIEDDFDISSSLGGLLGSIFMLGFMVSSPFVAHMAQFFHPLFLILLGQIVWSLAALGCGLAPNYWVLLGSRVFTGVGEASFVSLGPPIIMDIAPKRYVTLWLSFIYGVIYLGTALGLVFSAALNQAFGSWRLSFILEALMMVPLLVILIIVEKDPNFVVRKKSESGEEGQVSSVIEQIKKLVVNPIFMTICIGYGLYMFTIGGLSFWGPTVIHHLFSMSEANSAYFLGGVVCFCGLFGTIVGSVMVDIKSKKYSRLVHQGEMNQLTFDYYRTEISCFILFVSTLIGFAFLLSGLLVDNIVYFLIGFTIGNFFIFLATGPRSLAVMTCVSQELRGQANAIAILFMHILGDFPSPYIIGMLIQVWDYYWSSFFLIMMLSGAVVLWVLSWHLSKFHRAPVEALGKSGLMTSEKFSGDLSQSLDTLQ